MVCTRTSPFGILRHIRLAHTPISSKSIRTQVNILRFPSLTPPELSCSRLWIKSSPFSSLSAAEKTAHTSQNSVFNLYAGSAITAICIGFGLAGLFMTQGNVVQSDAPTKTEFNALKFVKSSVSETPSEYKKAELVPGTNAESSKFTRGEVEKHKTKETRIWVTYKDGVYDITDFVEIHPGGDRILLAAGQAVDPFWHIFAVHNSPEIREIIEGYRIGDLLPVDQDPTAEEVIARQKSSGGMSLLFANDPVRHPELKIRSSSPCNAESPDHVLVEPFLTPNDLFYVRNHLQVPDIDTNDFQLVVEGPGIPDGTTFTIDQLKSQFQPVKITASLQCAGNRRKDMHQVKPVQGLQWEKGAISNAVWVGPRLMDVLKAAGYSEEKSQDEVAHVQFEGAEGYGASIPYEKASDPRGDVILAYEMNGEPIPRDHGYPLRAIVPGHVAARSVKWVQKVVLSDEESSSHWQRRDYKGFSPSDTPATMNYDNAASIQELPVQSAIVYPNPDTEPEVDEKGNLVVKGYAYSGGGRSILRVDVSPDGGKSWIDATLKPREPLGSRGKDWSWTQWETRIPIPKETIKEDGTATVNLICKAVDSSYNYQPEGFAGIYNVRGVLSNAWHRVNAKVDASSTTQK